MQVTVAIKTEKHKLEKYEELLKEKKFTNYKVTHQKLDLNIITIRVTVSENKFMEVHKICKQVQNFFKEKK